MYAYIHIYGPNTSPLVFALDLMGVHQSGRLTPIILPISFRSFGHSLYGPPHLTHQLLLHMDFKVARPYEGGPNDHSGPSTSFTYPHSTDYPQMAGSSS